MLRASAADVAAQFRSDHVASQNMPERQRDQRKKDSRKNIFSSLYSPHQTITSYIGDPDLELRLRDLQKYSLAAAGRPPINRFALVGLG